MSEQNNQPDPVVVNKTPAQHSLDAVKAALLTTDPKFQMEVKYVEERLNFLLAKHGEPAIYALMMANLRVTIEKGQ